MAQVSASAPAPVIEEPVSAVLPGAPPREALFSLNQRRVLRAWCFLLFALYSTYAWVRHLRFLTTGFDLGIFDQVTRDYARFQAPIVPLKAPGYNLLGDHFHPLIALWAPLYWVWADPRMLLLAQAALVSASMIPVARFAARRWGGRRALLIAVFYGLSWPLQRMVQFDVHEIAFAVPLIAVVIDALDRRADRTVALACVALLLVREDMGAFVAVVGLLVVLRRRRAADGASPWPRVGSARKRSVLFGAGLVALGAVGFRIATGVVIPHFSGGIGFVYWTFPDLGPNLASAAKFSITHPFQVLELMVTPWEKAHTLLMLGLPTAYLSLGSPYVLLSLPFIAQRMLNSRELLWSTNFHYSSVLAPILVMGAVDTAHTLFGAADRWWAGRCERVPLATRRWPARWATAGGQPRARLQSLHLADVWIAWCLGVVVIAISTQASDYPVSEIVTAGFWAKDSRVLAIEGTLPLIPDDVCIESDNTIAAQLTDRDYVTRIDRSDDLATWMVLDFSEADTGWEGPLPIEAYQRALQRGFHVVSQQGVIVLLHKPGAQVDPMCRVR